MFMIKYIFIFSVEYDGVTGKMKKIICPKFKYAITKMLICGILLYANLVIRIRDNFLVIWEHNFILNFLQYAPNIYDV